VEASLYGQTCGLRSKMVLVKHSFAEAVPCMLAPAYDLQVRLKASLDIEQRLRVAGHIKV